MDVPCASALATMTNTSTGAMPLSAPTNRLPSSRNHVAPGQTSARITPTTRPIAMRKIRLTPLYAAAIFLRVFTKGFIGASSFFSKSNALTILFSLLRPQRRFH